MDPSAWLKALENTSFAAGVRDSLYWFPLIEALHVMALSVVFGTITIVDLRLLGLASNERRFARLSHELLRLTWCAFAVTAVTGAMMFVTNARVYADNTSFRVKMVLLALAGLNMVVFQLTAGRRVDSWDGSRRTPSGGRLAAACSLTLWIAVIFAGRVIGFTTTGAQAREAPPPTQNFDDFLGAAPQAEAATPTPSPDPSTFTIREIMLLVVDPSGDFLFESVQDIADERGVTHKSPRTDQEWSEVRHHLQALLDAPALLTAPGRRAAHPGDRSRDPAVENQPEQVQLLLDTQHEDFVQRAGRLRDAAALGLTAASARDSSALLAAITSIDKACESCHLHYWYPNDKRAHQAAQEEGGILE